MQRPNCINVITPKRCFVKLWVRTLVECSVDDYFNPPILEHWRTIAQFVALWTAFDKLSHMGAWSNNYRRQRSIWRRANKWNHSCSMSLKFMANLKSSANWIGTLLVHMKFKTNGLEKIKFVNLFQAGQWHYPSVESWHSPIQNRQNFYFAKGCHFFDFCNMAMQCNWQTN